MLKIGVETKRNKGAKGAFDTSRVSLSRREAKRFTKSYARARGYTRVLLSWCALALGLGTIYVALFYLPSLLRGSGSVVAERTGRSADMRLDLENEGFLSGHLSLLNMDRAYMRAGQYLTAQYALPVGQRLELEIIRCQSDIVVEVFRCNPVSAQRLEISDRTGSRRIRISENGFYHFNESATSDDYRVIWKRG